MRWLVRLAEVYSVFKLGGFESSGRHLGLPSGDQMVALAAIWGGYRGWRAKWPWDLSRASDATQIHLKTSRGQILNCTPTLLKSPNLGDVYTWLYMQVSFNPLNHPKPSTLVHRKLRFLLCRITIWFIILAFWHVVGARLSSARRCAQTSGGDVSDVRSSLVEPFGYHLQTTKRAQHPGFVQFEWSYLGWLLGVLSSWDPDSLSLFVKWIDWIGYIYIFP